MEGQQQISTTALDVVSIQCHYRFGHGWDIALTARHNGQTWDLASRRAYEYLSTEELAQVLHDEVERLLGM